MTDDELKTSVRNLIIETFSLDGAVPINIDVESVGRWDSLGHLALIEAIEDTYHVSFTHAETVVMLDEHAIIKMLASKL